MKARHNAEIVALTGRTRGSVERKYMNISAVLMALGLPAYPGLFANANAQFCALAAAIERYLDQHSNVWLSPTDQTQPLLTQNPSSHPLPFRTKPARADPAAGA